MCFFYKKHIPQEYACCNQYLDVSKIKDAFSVSKTFDDLFNGIFTKEEIYYKVDSIESIIGFALFELIDCLGEGYWFKFNFVKCYWNSYFTENINGDKRLSLIYDSTIKGYFYSVFLDDLGTVFIVDSVLRFFIFVYCDISTCFTETYLTKNGESKFYARRYKFFSSNLTDITQEIYKSFKVRTDALIISKSYGENYVLSSLKSWINNGNLVGCCKSEEFFSCTIERYNARVMLRTPEFLSYKVEKTDDTFKAIMGCKSSTDIPTLRKYSSSVEADTLAILRLIEARYKIPQGYLEVSRRTLTCQKEFVILIDIKKEIRNLIEEDNLHEEKF